MSKDATNRLRETRAQVERFIAARRAEVIRAQLMAMRAQVPG